MINFCAVKKMGSDVVNVLLGIGVAVTIVMTIGRLALYTGLFDITYGPGETPFWFDCVAMGVMAIVCLAALSLPFILAYQIIKQWYESSVESCKPRRKK